jgi:hypothetical protein
MNSEELERLAEDEDKVVRCTVARREDLPLDLVDRMAGDEHPFVREAIASRPDLPDDLVERLAGDQGSGGSGADG